MKYKAGQKVKIVKHPKDSMFEYNKEVNKVLKKTHHILTIEKIGKAEKGGGEDCYHMKEIGYDWSDRHIISEYVEPTPDTITTRFEILDL